MKPIDPRLRVLYLIALAASVFFVHAPWIALGLVASQALLWLVVRLPPLRLLRQISKLWFFSLFIIATYALTTESPDLARWVRVSILGFSLSINMGGVEEGVLMVLRVVAIVLGSQIARAGDSRAIAAGLGKLGLPLIAAP